MQTLTLKFWIEPHHTRTTTKLAPRVSTAPVPVRALVPATLARLQTRARRE